MTRLPLFAVSAFFLSALTPASAVVVHNTFGPGDSFSTTDAWIIFGPTAAFGGGNAFDMAAVFSLADDVYLDSVEVAIQHHNGTANVDVRITGDVGGLPDPSFLEEVTVLAPDGSAAIVTANFSGALLLSGGGTYWIWLSAPDDGDSSWSHNDQGFLGLAQSVTTDDTVNFFLTSDFATPAFRVNGTVVPEPSSSALLLGVAACLALVRRRA